MHIVQVSGSCLSTGMLLLNTTTSGGWAASSTEMHCQFCLLHPELRQSGALSSSHLSHVVKAAPCMAQQGWPIMEGSRNDGIDSWAPSWIFVQGPRINKSMLARYFSLLNWKPFLFFKWKLWSHSQDSSYREELQLLKTLGRSNQWFIRGDVFTGLTLIQPQCSSFLAATCKSINTQWLSVCLLRVGSWVFKHFMKSMSSHPLIRLFLTCFLVVLTLKTELPVVYSVALHWQSKIPNLNIL